MSYERRERARKWLLQHAALLQRVDDPVLRALIEAHGPVWDWGWLQCDECPPVPGGITGDPEPEGWPCGVWMFVFDRMRERPT